MKAISKKKPSEINELQQEMRAGFTELHSGFTEMRQQMQEINTSLVEVRSEMQVGLAEVRTGLTDAQHETREKFAESIQYTKMLRHEVQESIKDVLDTMNDYATHADAAISGLKSDVNQIKGIINTQMVTKDFLQKELYKFSGEIGGHLHKEDDKVNGLTDMLTEKKVLTKQEAKKIAQMGPSFIKV